MLSNALWKPMNSHRCHYYRFSVTFSAVNLGVCVCALLLSFRKEHACMSDKCSSVCIFTTITVIVSVIATFFFILRVTNHFLTFVLFTVTLQPLPPPPVCRISVCKWWWYLISEVFRPVVYTYSSSVVARYQSCLLKKPSCEVSTSCWCLVSSYSRSCFVLHSPQQHRIFSLVFKQSGFVCTWLLYSLCRILLDTVFLRV